MKNIGGVLSGCGVNDSQTAADLEFHEGQYMHCDVSNILVDEKLKIVTTPAFMLASRIK